MGGGSGGKGGDDDDDEDGGGASASARTGGLQSELPKVDNPLLVTIYGQLSLGARSYQSAICECFPLSLSSFTDRCTSSDYLLHAYDYCPHDPMVCLCLAIASMGRAMQRQADNRHHLVAQVRGPFV